MSTPLHSPARRFPLLDAVKVIATQLIVWHHLVLYGPMSETLRPYAPDLMDWVGEDARIAVQVFLVIGGFLAARALWPVEGAAPWPLGAQLWRRYLRLVRPYAVAVLVAVLSAAAARHLFVSETTPPAPTVSQLLAHLLLLQDVLGFPGLSAGVWYVAIDFQLFALLALLLWLSRAIGSWLDTPASWVATCLCSALMVASLWDFNRDDSLDIWAPYFFGSYGLGIAAACITRLPRAARGWPGAALAAVIAVALALDWRSRIAVAGCTALALLVLVDGSVPRAWRSLLARLDARLVRPLVRLSYAQFLIHYPVLLLVNALVVHEWPGQPWAGALAMVAAWLMSLGAARLLYRYAEQSAARAPSLRRGSPAPGLAA